MFFLTTTLLVSIGAKTAWGSTPPKVVVSIIPLHALVSGVMEGVNTPSLLVPKGASPHHYALRPSDIKKLQGADMVFWGGETDESFLVKPIKTLSPGTQVFALDKTPNLLLLKVRPGPLFEKGITLKTNETNEANEINATNSTIDPHYWLDPDNALVMVEEIKKRLIDIDPDHKKIYETNAKRFATKLKIHDHHIKTQLSPFQKVPFVVYHDAFQYFSRHYGLKEMGAITFHPELPPSVERIRLIENLIQDKRIHCIFREAGMKSKMVDTLKKQMDHLLVGELDPIGSPTSKGAEGYFKLLEDITNAFVGCLSKS